MTVKLPTNTLYILSGPPCTGKSTFLNTLNLSSDFVISSDALRIQLLGTRTTIDENGKVCEKISGSADKTVFEILYQMLHTRMSKHLTTFIDATSCTEKDRNLYAKIAEQYGMKTIVLIMTTSKEEALERNKTRPIYMPNDVIEKFFDKMAYTSAHDYILINNNEAYELQPDIIEGHDVDVVGDVHGLYDELTAFLEQNNYYIEDGIIKHPNNRRLLFVGDVVDRGQKSVEVLTLIAKSVRYGNHFMIKGNHDYKIQKYFDKLNTDNSINLSMSNAETVDALMTIKAKERDALLSFIKYLPFYKVCEVEGHKFVITHADISYFNPLTLTHDDAVYGHAEFGKVDSDRQYQQLFNAGITDYTLIRGHIRSTNETTQDNVLVLEMGQAFGGKLAMVSLDELVNEMNTANISPQTAFQKVVKTYQCTFNYNDVMQTRKLASALYELVDKKLVTVDTDQYGLKIYKYSKSVFWDALWDEHPMLVKARGIVLNATGKIVQHPFDKLFNYKIEYDAGMDIADDEEIIAVEKLNGFLGCITKHPYKNDLLITTSGSFDSPYVDYIRSFITSSLFGKLMKFFSKNDVTLMFEILHSDDHHIIAYDEVDLGLWLIGARGKNESDDPETESIVDVFAEELGFRRPNWMRIKMGELKEHIKTVNHEGYMVRKTDWKNTFVCKMKSPYYLTVKLLGRLSDKNTYRMFRDTNTFKKIVDEEFYDIIDILVKITTADELIAMDQNAKTMFVRDLIDVYLE